MERNVCVCVAHVSEIKETVLVTCKHRDRGSACTRVCIATYVYDGGPVFFFFFPFAFSVMHDDDDDDAMQCNARRCDTHS